MMLSLAARVLERALGTHPTIHDASRANRIRKNKLRRHGALKKLQGNPEGDGRLSSPRWPGKFAAAFPLLIH
jgi:hypothetical protein